MTLHTESWRSGFHRSWEHGGGYQRLMIVREREEWEGADQRVTVRTVEESWYALVHYRDSLSFCSFVVIKYLDKSNVRNKKYWFIAIGSQAYWEQDQSLEFSAVKEASGTESRPLCISLSLLLAVDVLGLPAWSSRHSDFPAMPGRTWNWKDEAFCPLVASCQGILITETEKGTNTESKVIMIICKYCSTAPAFFNSALSSRLTSGMK